MKQIVQSFSNGTVEVLDVPLPQTRPRHLLIRSVSSLISIGTERMLVDFGRASFIEKARQQPDRVKMVFDKIQTDGLLTTIEAVKSKLEHPIPLGYSNAGVVVAVGEGVKDFKVGDRVVSNGPHSEYVCVPQTLCARIPDGVDFDEAAFTVVASVGLQGVRLAEPTLGETFLVIGLGLIGLLTAQMLQAQGVRVLGADIDAARCDQARALGIEALHIPSVSDPTEYVRTFAQGRGVDGVLITASTKSSDPVTLAAQSCRTRGRIILVGVADLSLDRTEFYAKELRFQVSCSYGPGRYDAQYETKGQDYPFGFVRWTARRNFEAILELMRLRRLTPLALVDHRIEFNRAADAYDDALLKGARGVLLKYPVEVRTELPARTIELAKPPTETDTGIVVGLLGAGNYTAAVLAKNIKHSRVRLRRICSPGALNAALLGRKFGFESVSSDPETLFTDPEINTVVVSVRHDLHVPYVLRALAAGKHVFVEKPLAVNEAQLDELCAAYEALDPAQRPALMVGFNRRFAPFVEDVKKAVCVRSEGLHVVMTINAGALPADHWTQDLKSGGGRLIGEGCHFVDLARHLVGHPIAEVSAEALPSQLPSPDSFSARIRFRDGSLATILYLANGARQFPKERIEVFSGGAVYQIDNFRRLKAFGRKGFRNRSAWRQDKGHAAAWAAFLAEASRGEEPAIPFEEMVEVTRATFQMQKQLAAAVFAPKLIDTSPDLRTGDPSRESASPAAAILGSDNIFL